jgi:hypothetical protein
MRNNKQHKIAREHIYQQLETERWTCDQAAHEQPLQAESVILTARYLVEQGRNNEAQALVAEWRASKKSEAR